MLLIKCVGMEIKMKETKYFTKQLLIEYNNAAIRERRSQAIKEEFLKSLPEKFLFPIVFKMYHAKNEIRVQISFFDKGRALLDMTEERYDMLPVAKWNDKTQELQLEDENEIRKKFPYKNREWTEKVIKQPYRRQGRFRKEVLKAYDNTCAICGINEPRILRAAHIIPVAMGGSDDIQNGICLCTNHEVAFDKGLIKIRPDGMIELRSSKLGVTFDKILYPKNRENYPFIEFLRKKYEMD